MPPNYFYKTTFHKYWSVHDNFPFQIHIFSYNCLQKFNYYKLCTKSEWMRVLLQSAQQRPLIWRGELLLSNIFHAIFPSSTSNNVTNCYLRIFLLLLLFKQAQRENGNHLYIYAFSHYRSPVFHFSQHYR